MTISYNSGFKPREGWVEIAPGVSMPREALLESPHVNWRHIDGPLMTWAGHLEWLTFRERLRLFFRLATIEQIAAEHWPHLAALRDAESSR